MKRKEVAAAVGALALGALGGVVVYERWAARRAAAPLALSCVAGETRFYALAYHSTGELSPNPLFAVGDAPQRVTATFDGEWRERCLEVGAEGHVLEITVVAPHGALTVTGSSPRGGDELFTDRTVVRVSPEGQVRSLVFGERLDGSGQNLVRDMLSLRSMVLRTAERWSADEQDLGGTYTSAYEVEGRGVHDTHVRKTRERYRDGGEALRGTATRAVPVVLPGSGADIHVDVKGRALVSVASTSVTGVTWGARESARSESRLRLVYLRTEAGAALASGSPGAAPRGSNGAALDPAGADPAVSDLAATDVDARLDERMQRDELGSDTWATIRARVDRGDVDAPHTFLQVMALLRLQPDAAKLVARELARREPLPAKAFLLYAGALARTGTKAAQAALLDALESQEGHDEQRDMLVGAMGSIPRPSIDVERRVRGIATSNEDPSARTAALALGTFADRLRAVEPSRSEALEREALARVEHAGSADDRRFALVVLGNAATPRAIPVAGAALRDADVFVREAAAQALRDVADPSVEPLLLGAALSDPAPSVRVAALEALAQRYLAQASVEALVAKLAREPDEDARLVLVRIVGNEAERAPELVDVLKRVADTDVSTSVRSAAATVVLRIQSMGT